MKTLYFVCHDGQTDVPPLIVIFTVEEQTETEDVIEVFGKALSNFVPGSEDCPPVRYAADKVCEYYGATVEFVEAEQVFGITDQSCSKCRVSFSEEHDNTAPSPYNTGYSDASETCWNCHVDMLESGKLTQCENCHEYFTPNHLLRNKDVADHSLEICPYCGEIWCE